MKIIKIMFVATLVVASLSACNSSKKCNNECCADTTEVVGDSVEAMQMPELSQTFGEWKIVKVGDMTVDFDASLVINDDNTFGAHICNSFGGEVAQELRRPDAICFKNVARTDMMGPEEQMKVEDAFAEVLNKVQFFAVKGNTLQLLDADNNVVMEGMGVN